MLTTSDAGGPLEFVADGVDGLVCAPEPAALAEAIDKIFALGEPRLRELGEAGRERVVPITWDTVLDRLTEGIA